MQKTAESETSFGYIWVNLKPVSHNQMRSKIEKVQIKVTKCMCQNKHLTHEDKGKVTTIYIVA